jgi:EAL domain-containing protein (putative c-di-GMP-specific phosphodiesterase class I)/CheY-like chemotaxis protein
MYRAKEVGRNSYQFFRTEMNARALERMSMESHLRRALERDEFRLHYQPKVDLASGEITGLEALLRWSHAELGPVPPSRFVPILEDNGMILEVGQWVLAEVCRQLQRWGADEAFPLVPVALNISGRQLLQKDIGARLRRIIAESGVAPRLLEFEITETVLMRDPDKTSILLHGLQELGIRLSVDDFGTGYSCLGYLKSFPLDTLKIDRAFVKDIVTDPDDAMITRAIISMAHSLRLKVVGEGVETASQQMLLAAAGCDEMQGYLFSKPLPADECAALLRERRRLAVLARGGGGGATLLLVDDEAIALEMSRALLSGEGYRVLAARSAEEALELMAGHDVDVVVSDHRMPGMSGVELMRRVKGLYPDVVRILMSMEVDARIATEAVNQGSVFKVLDKAIDPESLRAAVREAFVERRSMRQGRVA